MKKIRVFEAFSGIGSQRMALRNINLPFEVVATSEINYDAIIAYYAVHESNNFFHTDLSVSDQKHYLEKLGLKVKNFNDNKIEKLYKACILTKNLGDISLVSASEVPDHDLFTYSFPCQDISTMGELKGFDEGSGTRSSLLWECKKIIMAKKPKYLMMENVKNLIVGKNRSKFQLWLKFLEEQGYENYWKIMDSKDYGIPQRRPRIIMISKLGRARIDLLKDNDFENKTIDDILEKNLVYKEYTLKAPLRNKIDEGEVVFLDDRDWKMNGTLAGTICSTQRARKNRIKMWIFKK